MSASLTASVHASRDPRGATALGRFKLQTGMRLVLCALQGGTARCNPKRITLMRTVMPRGLSAMTRKRRSTETTGSLWAARTLVMAMVTQAGPTKNQAKSTPFNARQDAGTTRTMSLSLTTRCHGKQCLPQFRTCALSLHVM